MYTNDILSYICKSIPDKRAHNKTIPYDIIWAISIAAKMKIKTSFKVQGLIRIAHRAF